MNIASVFLDWSSESVFAFSHRHQFGKESEASSYEENEPSGEETMSQGEIFREDESNYATLASAAGSEVERRSKFEELQAASKNLERRLHEDDDYRRRQELERRMNKEKSPRYATMLRAAMSQRRDSFEIYSRYALQFDSLSSSGSSVSRFRRRTKTRARARIDRNV